MLGGVTQGSGRGGLAELFSCRRLRGAGPPNQPLPRPAGLRSCPFASLLPATAGLGVGRDRAGPNSRLGSSGAAMIRRGGSFGRAPFRQAGAVGIRPSGFGLLLCCAQELIYVHESAQESLPFS